MPAPFAFVRIPPATEKFFGKRDPDTLVYRREGSEDECGLWFDRVMEVTGGAVSPGGVCMYARVSRAAVYKAINEGRLTAFGFHVVYESRSVFGFKRKIRNLPYVFVPVSEAKAWGEIIAAKVKAKQLTREDEPGQVDERTMRELEDPMLRGKCPRKKKEPKK